MKITTTKTETLEQDIDLSIPKCFKSGTSYCKYEGKDGKEIVTTFDEVLGFDISQRNKFYEQDVSIMTGKTERYEPITEEEFNNTLKEKLLVYGIIESINDVQNVNIG